MEDYKKLYLEQKRQSLMLEMNLLQLRAGVVGEELPEIEKQLTDHVNKDEVKAKK
jgi:hypothetical protein